jgi:hypothetical protein
MGREMAGMMPLKSLKPRRQFAGTISRDDGRGMDFIAAHRLLQRRVEFSIALRSLKVVAERAAEAGDDAFIFG